MNDTLSTVLETLLDEIARYLEVVDVFRAVGCEPVWLPESAVIALRPPTSRSTRTEKSAH